MTDHQPDTGEQAETEAIAPAQQPDDAFGPVLHITHNPNGNSGSHILCGAERRHTYRTLAEGTADRYVDRYFVERPDITCDPALCRNCLEIHDTMRPATLPDILRRPTIAESTLPDTLAQDDNTRATEACGTLADIMAARPSDPQTGADRPAANGTWFNDAVGHLARTVRDDNGADHTTT
ncbi:hypothetical protein [Kitasatospora mediocidica]|uniref:hypothetical protein n=1 Tax=Kitasatospora mediocidica TaxID=58352 RepID=UPI00055DFBD2|nr:hypothetical protein [Kitasatospora mediocidica]